MSRPSSMLLDDGNLLASAGWATSNSSATWLRMLASRLRPTLNASRHQIEKVGQRSRENGVPAGLAAFEPNTRKDDAHSPGNRAVKHGELGLNSRNSPIANPTSGGVTIMNNLTETRTDGAQGMIPACKRRVRIWAASR